MKVMNIISRFNVGGTAQWLFQLSDGLTKNEIQNIMLVGTCPTQELEDERLNSINYKRIKGLGPSSSLFASIQSFFAIRSEIKKFKPDIVNTHTSKAGVVGRLAAISVLYRPKIVHTYHGHVLFGYYNKTISSLITFIERILSTVTDQHFVLGEKVLSDLEKAKIVRKSNYTLVLPGVADFVKINKESARKALGLDQKSFVVGWLGRKVSIKRLDRILDLAQENPDLKFLIAGVGTPVSETFNERFKNGKLRNVIEFGLSTPSQIWSASDVCLITSDNEGMPTSAIEASLFGIPVVSTAAGSISDIVEHGKSGFICNSLISEISSELRKLSDSPELTQRMGESGRKIALEKFSPEKSLNSQIYGYKKVLKLL